MWTKILGPYNKNSWLISERGFGLKKKIWAIAGGKGGTGKTVITSNLGVGLAILGYKVILIDGDLGGANLHLFFDITVPKRSLNDFLSGRVSSLEEVILPTQSNNLGLICGNSGLMGVANLPFKKKEKLIHHIVGLNADFILVDLGAGITHNILDIFGICHEPIIVCNPEPQAKFDAYAFAKNALYRRLNQAFIQNNLLKDLLFKFGNNQQHSIKVWDLIHLVRDKVPEYGERAQTIVDTFRPKFILNKVRRKSQVEDAGMFLSYIKEFLGVQMDLLGHIEHDERVVDACEKMRPFLLEQPTSKVSLSIYNILFNLGIEDRQLRYNKKTYKKMSNGVKLESRLWK